MKNLFSLIWFLLISAASICQVVNIPDTYFKNSLINNTSINTNGDAEIQVSEATAFSGLISVSNTNISDLTGIEAFTVLSRLCVINTQITTLDVSSNLALSELTCYNNQLSSINVSANIALTLLSCRNNHLTSLDVSNNVNLVELQCGNNPLVNLDVSNNDALTELACDNTQLTTLDVSNNTNLVGVYCFFAQLTSLNLSDNPALFTLYCGQNQLTELNLSGCPALADLQCFNNQLTNLDVSNNPALEYLICAYNHLPDLDFSANPELRLLACTSAHVENINVSSNSALSTLLISCNALTTLDVSSNTALTELQCGFTFINSLDVSNNTALTELRCGGNYSLRSLNLKNGNNVNLTDFKAFNSPNLTCIEVDNPAWANINWTVANGNIDSTARFSKFCEVDYHFQTSTDTDFSLSVNGSYDASQLIIFPNPAINSLTIETESGKGTYQFQDITGKLLLSGNVTANKFSLDISALSKGIYLLSLIDGEQQVNRKVVKE